MAKEQFRDQPDNVLAGSEIHQHILFDAQCITKVMSWIN